jgi:hypothetical protein
MTYRAVDITLTEADRVSIEVFKNAGPAFLDDYEQTIRITKFDDSIESQFPDLFVEAIPRPLGPYTEVVALPESLETIAVNAVHECSKGNTERVRALVTSFDIHTFNPKILLHPYDYALAHVAVSAATLDHADILAIVLPRISVRLNNNLRSVYYKKYLTTAVRSASEESHLDAVVSILTRIDDPMLAPTALRSACTLHETPDTVNVVEYVLDRIEKKGAHNYQVYMDALRTASEYGKANVVEYLLGRISYLPNDLQDLLKSKKIAISFRMNYRTLISEDRRDLKTESAKRGGIERRIIRLLEDELYLVRYIIGLENECPEGKVLNPKTGRCVDAKGKIGRALLK